LKLRLIKDEGGAVLKDGLAKSNRKPVRSMGSKIVPKKADM
jgi:hypothetical protein